MRKTHSRRGATVLQTVALAALFSAFTWGDASMLRAQSPRLAANPLTAIDERELKEWLTYLASDELQGRQTFTEGYGLAAQYVATQLKAFGVKPLGPNGSYLQPVRLRGYKATRNSVVTVVVGGQTHTFKHGDHVTFPANAGGRQTVRFDTVEFVGYARAEDLEGRDLKGKLVVAMPTPPPATGRGAPPAATAAAAAAPAAGRGRGGQAEVMARGAAAFITFAATPAAPSAAEQALTQAQAALAQATAAVAEAQRGLRGGGGRGGPAAPAAAGRGGQQNQTPDFTTTQRIDTPVPPQLSGDETFFDALFTGHARTFAATREAGTKGEAPAPATLKARVTIDINHAYETVSQQVTHNVVGLIDGSDGRLRDTYVLFGAHLDHVGYAQTGAPGPSGFDRCRRRSPAAQEAVRAAGKVVQRPTPAPGGRGAGGDGRGGAAPAPPPFDERDFISNGADDDGSGSVALLAIAKAFAVGPKPRRSIVVAWHAGEEGGLHGSRFNADHPVVPIDRIQAAFNMDMIGRDDCNNVEGDYRNSVFVVGADRISTDLHNLVVESNRTLPEPMTLDFELNDPEDPEGVYTRSDHYSYAQKGIPVAFFTTGLHPDYHRVSDSVDKIRFDKLARVTRLVYQSGFAVADRERPLTRDNRGPRTGFGTRAEPLK